VTDWQESVMLATDTLGQLGCMWLACRTPSSGQWTIIYSMKLKDTVLFTVAWLAMEMCQSSPMHYETDQLGPPVRWGVGSSLSDGNVPSIQAIVHTGCPLLPCGFQERAASGEKMQCVGSQEARRRRR
jgi:hypothetical protein